MDEEMEKKLNEFLDKRELMKAEQRDARGSLAILIPLIVAVIVSLIVFLLKRYFEKEKTRKVVKISKTVGPITREPIVPFRQDSMTLWRGDSFSENVIPEVRILCRFTLPWKKRESIDKMNSIMKKIFDLDVKEGDDLETKEAKNEPVPKDARLISIKMNGFKHGDKCHDFVPIDGIKEGGYFTYQMFGDNRIQVTNYVEDDVSYVAGFCIYIEDPCSPGDSFPEDVIISCINSKKYREESKTIESKKSENKKPENIRLLVIPKEELTVEYCPNLERNMMTFVKSGKVIHQEWNPNMKRMVFEKCQKCQLVRKSQPNFF